MPTGYTHYLFEKRPSFKEWTLICARAMGAAIMMRDEPLEVPAPPKLTDIPDYYSKRIDELNAEKKRVEALSEIEHAADQERIYESALKDNDRYWAACEAENEVLDAMSAQVSAWIPPTPNHQGLKDFMLDQISAYKQATYLRSNR